jgi:hypothetical protein
VPVLVPLLARASSRWKITPRANIRYGDTQAARNCRSLLNFQQNDSSVIGSRLVCDFGGIGDRAGAAILALRMATAWIEKLRKCD